MKRLYFLHVEQDVPENEKHHLDQEFNLTDTGELLRS